LAAVEALETEGLSVSYSGAEACRDISVRVAAGEVVALLGANGAGKTTTLRAISGLHAPSSGRVSYAGHDLTGQPPHVIARRGIGHVPEGRRLFGKMTVRENLEVGLYRKWSDKSAQLDAAFDLFPELFALQKNLAFSLSGGEQQMVAMARALLPDPEILMLDEPSLGLAPIIVDRIIDTITALRERGKGVLLVEQDTSVALLCSDRGYVLANGRVVFAGDREQLRDSEKLSEAYIGT
jgi:branched-chain amino acid transport system ATP-binding protein